MRKRINFAIVGCGRISDLHAPPYLANPKARLVAVCDIDSGRACEKGREWGVHGDSVCTDYDTLLKRSDIDAVELLVPHHLHADMTVRAAEAGKHVSIQKPMAMNTRECRMMIDSCRKAGVKLRVFENFRFYPPYVRAKQLIDSGILGRPSFIHIKLGTSLSGGWPVPMDAWLWRFDPQTCGGGPTVWDDGYHKFSIARYFLGDVEKVAAWIDRTGVFEDDSEPPAVLDSPAVLMWKYKRPRTYGSMEVTWSREGAFPSKYYAADERIEITGDKGYLWVNQCTANTLRNEAPLIAFAEGKLTEYRDVEIDWQASFRDAVNHFIDAILHDSEPCLTGEEGLEVQRFSEAAHASSRRNTEVLVESVQE